MVRSDSKGGDRFVAVPSSVIGMLDIQDLKLRQFGQGMWMLACDTRYLESDEIEYGSLDDDYLRCYSTPSSDSRLGRLEFSCNMVR